MTPTKIENKHKKILTAANVITLLRIIGTGALFFTKSMSLLFLSIYTFAGLTDVLDGLVARRTGTASEFGARLDSIADLLFCVVILIKLAPVLWVILPQDIWYGTAAILLIRIVSYITAAIKFRRFASLHTYLNKLTGIAVFLLPYMLAFSWGTIYSRAVCVLAFLASLEELAVHIFRKEYNADRKSIFQS
ncbi:MAG: CDP-alcohol phosphatidyltransferase family protein [Oscillospiraceae bacterium]|nr:CDP-alcohol phosphatidyltransferase family protein [Oscillospiraceae bacterium]